VSERASEKAEFHVVDVGVDGILIDLIEIGC
jgi:hypothetical protein